MEKTVHDLKEAFYAINPYIQRHTSKVCPSCQNVCCINKHGYYEREDLVFIRALGLNADEHKSGREDTDPCMFLQAFYN